MIALRFRFPSSWPAIPHPCGVIPHPCGATPSTRGATPSARGVIRRTRGVIPHLRGVIPHLRGVTPSAWGAVPHPCGDTPNTKTPQSKEKFRQNKLPNHGAALGLSPTEIADAAMYRFLEGDLKPSLSQTLKQVLAYALRVNDGPLGVATGAPPTPGVLAAPPEVLGGILPRTRALVRRLKAARGWLGS